MKKNTLLLALLALIGAPAWAYDFSATTSSNHIIYINVSGAEATVTYQTSTTNNYANQSGDLIIPSTVENNGTTYTVTAIGPNAFKNTHFSTITIPSTVNNIGSYAFRSSDITSLVLPDAVTALPNYLCANCTSLTTVTLGNAVTSIGPSAFVGCSALISINLPSTLNTISGNAFSGCTSLHTITVPAAVSAIGYNAFGGIKMVFYDGNASGAPWGAGYLNGFVDGDYYYASSARDTLVGINDFVTSANILPSVTTILANALAGCTAITTLTIPQNVLYIGNGAFANCTSLATVNFNADSCIYMGNSNSSVFNGCTAFTTLNIGTNVKVIPSYAFHGCAALTSVLLPEGLGIIGERAFGSCTSLTTANLPNSVYWIYGQPFLGCTAINTPITNNWCMLLLPAAWQGSYTIPDGITLIADYAFNQCSSLTSVTIQTSVTTIDHNAFYGCLALDTINLLSSVPPQPQQGGNIANTLVDQMSGNNVRTNYSRRTVNVPCGSLAAYKQSQWSVFQNIKSPCAVHLTVLPTLDSIVIVDSVFVNGHLNYSSGWYEVGDTATLAAQQFTWRATNEYGQTATMQKVYTQFLGWSDGGTDWVHQHVVTNDDTVYAFTIYMPGVWPVFNRCNTRVNIYGNIGFNGGTSTQSVNDGNNGYISTIFQTALWVGTPTNLAAVRFMSEGHDYFPGPLRLTDAKADISTVMQFARVWFVSRYMIDYHIAHCGEEGYIPEDDIATWPGNGPDGYAAQLAPYYDADSDGVYNPLAGDYPIIRGDRCVFTIFNDNYMPHGESGGVPLGIEVHAITYAFDNPSDTSLHTTIFQHFDIYNRSANNYDSTYLGAFSDFDIGSANDDYIGCDVQRNMYYGYNGTNTDLSGYTGVPPAQSCTFLGGGQPASGNRLGMTNFTYYLNSSSGINAEPAIPSDYYNYMRSYWRNGVHVKFGNMGLNGEINCTHMFPWDSDTAHISTGGIDPGYLWAECLMPDNVPGDRRGVGASGPFTFTTGSCQQLDLAYTTAWGSNNIDAIRVLGTATDAVRSQWLRDTTDAGIPFVYRPYSAPHSVGIDNVASIPFRVYPNPTTGQLHISGVGEIDAVQLFDITGRRILAVPANAGSAVIDLTPLPQGIYILRAGGAVHRVVKH